MRFEDSNLIGWIRFDETVRPDQLLDRGGRMESTAPKIGGSHSRSNVEAQHDAGSVVEEVDYIIADVKQLCDELKDECLELVF